MPRRNIKLTDTQIRNAKPREKKYKLYDDEGLQLLIRPTGTKVWQYPFKLHGSLNTYTIGRYTSKTSVYYTRFNSQNGK